MSSEESKVRLSYRVDLDPEEIVRRSGSYEITQFILELISQEHDYDMELIIFNNLMSRLVSYVEDEYTTADDLLEIDEIVKEAFDLYRKAWSHKV